MARLSLGRNGGGRGGGDRSVKSSWDIEGDNDDNDWFSDNNNGLGGETEKTEDEEGEGRP